MADEEQQDEGAEPEEPQAEEPQPEEPQAEEADAGSDTQAETAPEPESDEGSDPSSGEEPAEPQADQPAEQVPAEEPAAETPKAKDQAPGADLEPIALEPERELSAEERARAEAEAEERARAEAEAEGDVVADEPVAREAVKLAADTSVQATGKRKSAIARVVVRSGSGAFEINSRQLDEYFPRHQHQTMARQPLVTAGYESTVDVRVRVHGGGVGGQAGAVRHGIARALTEIDPELRGELKRRGFLTRDAREKERRKAGLKKARKRPQFSKR